MELVAGQSGPYIPTTDEGVRNFLNNFASKIAVNPASFGLSNLDSQTLNTLAQQFDAAYQKSIDPEQRTTPVIGDKDAKRNQAVETFRVYAMQIKENLGVSDEQKLALGLHLDDTTNSPIPAPLTYPLLAVVSAENGLHVIRYADSDTPDSKAKPPGSSSLQLFRIVADQPDANINNALFVGSYTKQPIQIAYGPEDASKTATYVARWCTQRGLTGPWGPAVAMTIAFGGPIQMESAA